MNYLALLCLIKIYALLLTSQPNVNISYVKIWY